MVFVFVCDRASDTKSKCETKRNTLAEIKITKGDKERNRSGQNMSHVCNVSIRMYNIYRQTKS